MIRYDEGRLIVAVDRY